MRLNALKGLLSLVIATVTVVIFSIGAPVDWLSVALLAPTTLAGGFLGAKLARRLPDRVLRWCVVVLGVAVGIYLLVE
ncbi:sulfite exporter TauE/SafE family protein [Pseudonocardia nigra]|uniref:sulfite exporter TauE/SafE family protein n=1 Tax=Pseudonocardia nigra TaxID=1921578 RepID=UPI0027E3606B|nr:sulfite exporter TauE/SafE family protein [Pseudonocardia nigra]